MDRRRLLKNRLARGAVRPLLPVERTPGVRLGSGYGGWWIPDVPLAKAVAYCVGVGEDITFDLGLVDRGYQVWSFDPTPRSITWISQRQLPESLHFEPVGLWGSDTVLRFYEPANPAHVSYSATNIQATERYVEAPVERLSTIMERLGHSSLDILKLDIEGAEVAVLDDMIASGILPRVLCVEFDEPETPWTHVARVRRLVAQGYLLRNVERWNYTFEHQLGARH